MLVLGVRALFKCARWLSPPQGCVRCIFGSFAAIGHLPPVFLFPFLAIFAVTTHVLIFWRSYWILVASGAVCRHTGMLSWTSLTSEARNPVNVVRRLNSRYTWLCRICNPVVGTLYNTWCLACWISGTEWHIFWCLLSILCRSSQATSILRFWWCWVI